MPDDITPTMVFFVCLHGSAKSLIAAQHFNRMARDRGLPLNAESMGVEPDADVPAPVVAGLADDGFDVRHYAPQRIEPARLAVASCVVSFGCEVPTADLPASRFDLQQWDDLPLVSDGFERARDAIVARVARLVDALADSGEGVERANDNGGVDA